MPNASSEDEEFFCPHCRGRLERGGEPGSRYWSCRSCNLLFLA